MASAGNLWCVFGVRQRAVIDFYSRSFPETAAYVSAEVNGCVAVYDIEMDAAAITPLETVAGRARRLRRSKFRHQLGWIASGIAHFSWYASPTLSAVYHAKTPFPHVGGDPAGTTTPKVKDYLTQVWRDLRDGGHVETMPRLQWSGGRMHDAIRFWDFGTGLNLPFFHWSYSGLFKDCDRLRPEDFPRWEECVHIHPQAGSAPEPPGAG